MANGIVELINYLIPSGTTPRGYLHSTVFSATPITLDFRNISGGSFDGLPFRPSGMFIDNSQGTDDLDVTINELAYTISCPAGNWLNIPFPAPINTTVNMVGLGQATVLFVDFPVLPFQQTGNITIAWGSITGTLSSQTDLQNALNLKLTDPTTTAGDIIYRNGAGIQRLPIGTSGQVLEVVSGEPVWTTPSTSATTWGSITGTLSSQTDLQTALNAKITDPTTTTGDLIYRDGGGNIVRLPIGTANQRLTVTGGVPVWAAQGFTNPMTTNGDLITRVAGVTARLGIGTSGQVLTVASGLASWATPASGGMANPMTTLGDIITGAAAGAPQRLGVGTAGQVLTTVSGAPAWAAPAAPADGAWINMTGANSAFLNGTYVNRYRLLANGNTVEVECSLAATFVAGTPITAFTLPAGFRPSGNITGSGASYNSGVVAPVIIIAGSSGTFQMYGNAGSPSTITASIRFSTL
jgi:hypothetical protein